MNEVLLFFSMLRNSIENIFRICPHFILTFLVSCSISTFVGWHRFYSQYLICVLVLTETSNSKGKKVGKGRKRAETFQHIKLRRRLYMQCLRIKRFFSSFFCLCSSLLGDESDNGNHDDDYVGGGDKGLLHAIYIFSFSFKKKNDFILTFPEWIFAFVWYIHIHTHP